MLSPGDRRLVPQVTIFSYGFTDAKWQAFVGEHFRLETAVRYHGALDDLSDDQLDALRPVDGGTAVPIEMPDESWRNFDVDKLDRHCRECIDELAKENDDPVLMFCTAPWFEVQRCANVILPFRILEHTAISLMADGSKIGVIQPYAETAEHEIKHWQQHGVDVVSRIVSSYDDSTDALVDACLALESDGAGVIGLDCLAFTEEHYRAVRDAVSVPVLLPMRLIAGVVNATYA